MMQIDWEALWQAMAAEFQLGPDSIHGPAHWRRVEAYGLDLARHSGGDLLVVRLFAVFHDVGRRNDHRDAAHGQRGAEMAARLRGHAFALPDAAFAQLQYACTWHTDGQTSEDPTIGACWDADRLDLWRAGILPTERYMSTAHGRALARAGQVGPAFVPTPGPVG